MPSENPGFVGAFHAYRGEGGPEKKYEVYLDNYVLGGLAILPRIVECETGDAVTPRELRSGPKSGSLHMKMFDPLPGGALQVEVGGPFARQGYWVQFNRKGRGVSFILPDEGKLDEWGKISLLYGGGASFSQALEWNPDSVSLETGAARYAWDRRSGELISCYHGPEKWRSRRRLVEIEKDPENPALMALHLRGLETMTPEALDSLRKQFLSRGNGYVFRRIGLSEPDNIHTLYKYFDDLAATQPNGALGFALFQRTPGELEFPEPLYGLAAKTLA